MPVSSLVCIAYCVLRIKRRLYAVRNTKYARITNTVSYDINVNALAQGL